jgi:hypothetical protein
MSVHEVAMGFSFITATLKADSQWVTLSPGGVKRGKAPSGSLFPLTIISYQSGIDVIFENAVRSSVNALYQIKAVGPSDNTQAIFDLASCIDELFKRTKGTVTGGNIIGCYRESPLAYEDDTAGIQYSHIGGLYRVRTEQTS